MRTLPRRFLLSLAAALVLPVSAQTSAPGASSPPAKAPIGSTFVDWNSLSFRVTPVGLYCPVFDNPTPTLEGLELHLTALRPGMASHPPHHHPGEELILIKEGKLEVSINGKKQPAGPGALIFYASNDLHNLTNVGSTLATYYVINFRTAAVHTVRDQPAAEWAPKQMLPSCVVDCDRLPPPEKPGAHQEVFDSPTLTFLRLESHVTTLGPGQGTSPRNRDPGDELFIVRSGALDVTLNSTTRHLVAGSLYYVAPNDERTMKNNGETPCSYQVIKVVSEKTPPKA